MSGVLRSLAARFGRAGDPPAEADAPPEPRKRRKKRWRILGWTLAVLLLLAVSPILWVESACRAPVAGLETGSYRPILTGADTRPEARTWLTYPEWHIVYSADSLGRHLKAGKAPSAYDYGTDVRAFWGSLCSLNRAAQGGEGVGAAKVMLYTIGVSFTAEMGVKAVYENTIGRLAEWLGGTDSVDDAHAAGVQADYGAFMHETPWYKFDFRGALARLWSTDDGGLRHWERRFALSLEYGVKAGYAGLLGWASGQALGADEVRLRMVTSIPREWLAADPSVEIRRAAGKSLVVDAPRYASFTTLAGRLAQNQGTIEEIAGNDDILVTFLAPDKARDAVAQGPVLIEMELGDRPGWRRIGVAVKVPQLLARIRAARAVGAELEHVYDY